MVSSRIVRQSCRCRQLRRPSFEIKLCKCKPKQCFKVMHSLFGKFDDSPGDQCSCGIMANGKPELMASGFKRHSHVAKRFRFKNLTGKEWSDRHGTPIYRRKCNRSLSQRRLPQSMADKEPTRN
jgi:hypothetical protein